MNALSGVGGVTQAASWLHEWFGYGGNGLGRLARDVTQLRGQGRQRSRFPVIVFLSFGSCRRSMTIRFEKQEDGTFERTGELPDGTAVVWIYQDGRRSRHPFALELAVKIIEKCIPAFPWIKSYELRPTYSGWQSGIRHVGPDQIEGLARGYVEVLWPEAEQISDASRFDLDVPLAVLVSVENERLLQASPMYEIQRDEQGKVVLVKCDACGAQFFIFYHRASVISPWDRRRLLHTVEVDLMEILARDHKLGSEHTHDRPFEIL